MKRLVFLTWVTACMAASQVTLASESRCKVTRVAGKFQSFTQPEVGDTVGFDLDAEMISDLQVGTANISTGNGLIQRPIEGIIQFTAKQSGEATYMLQLTLFGDDLAQGILQSVVESNGNLSVGVAELSCGSAK